LRDLGLLWIRAGTAALRANRSLRTRRSSTIPS
jgi:hypothetical protein